MKEFDIIKKIVSFEIKEQFSSKWILLYGLAFFIFNSLVFYFSFGKNSEIIATLTNFYLILIPIFTTILTAVTFSDSLSFQNLILVRGISRNILFIGKSLGIFISLSLSFVFGLISVVLFAPKIESIFSVILIFLLLSLVLQLYYLYLCLFINQVFQKLEIILGTCFGIWLFLFVFYDALIFYISTFLSDYPIEWLILILVFLNPFDLLRTLIYIQGNLYSIMNYSSAVYLNQFSGTLGVILGIFILLVWTLLLFWLGLHLYKKREI